MITTTASAKWLATDLLLSGQYDSLLFRIRKLLKDNEVDTVCLNVPDETFSDKSLRYFLKEGIIPHIGIDYADSTKLSELYIDKSDRLDFTSQGDSF